MASGLTRKGPAHHFIQYAILQCVNLNNTFITAQIIYPVQNQRDRLSYENLIKVMNTIRDKVIEYNTEHESDAKFIIYLDNESYNSDAIFSDEYYTTYFDFRIYNKIVPGYTTCLKDLKIETFDKQFETAIKEILYYVRTVGHSCFLSKIGDNEVSFAYTARRWLEHNEPFKAILKKNSSKSIKRFPKYDFVWEVARDVKKFNANKLVKHGKAVKWVDVCKYDINSSFWSIPMTEYTGTRPKKIKFNEHGVTKEGFDLEDIKKYYMVKENMYFAKIKIDKTIYTKSNKVDWLDIFGINFSEGLWVTNVEIEDMLDTYEISLDDIELLDFYILEKVPFLPTQREFYEQLHKQKSVAKSNKDELLKNCLKIIGHCLHGFAIGNWFTEEYNDEYYYKMLRNAFTPYAKNANLFLTPIDSMYFYSYARQHLLKILDLFKDNFYFDTDSVVAPYCEENIKKYNEWINEKYANMGLDSKNYTYDGHTIGYLELEEKCENFCHLSPKFYLWTHDNKLHSTTAGFNKNSIAKSIEKTSGKFGKDALQWFINQKYLTLNVGYISNGKEYVLHTYRK